MSTEQADELKHYFCFRVINPVGDWIVKGPYDSNDHAMAARERAKAAAVYVTAPVLASSKDDALRKCNNLEGARYWSVAR